jgi:S-adenosylhomocysteine hydrolase
MIIKFETVCKNTANEIVRCIPNFKVISHHHLQDMKKQFCASVHNSEHSIAEIEIHLSCLHTKRRYHENVSVSRKNLVIL